MTNDRSNTHNFGQKWPKNDSIEQDFGQIDREGWGFIEQDFGV